MLSCSYCILCTGGIGRVYPYTTNSAIATGDGITLAHEMGARIRNLHLVQFHPTAFAAAQGRSGFSSRRRSGEKARPLLNKDGERFMYRYDERGELAPRDVVSVPLCGRRPVPAARTCISISGSGVGNSSATASP